VAPPTPPCAWRYEACVVLFGSKAEHAAPDTFRQYLVRILSGILTLPKSRVTCFFHVNFMIAHWNRP